MWSLLTGKYNYLIYKPTFLSTNACKISSRLRDDMNNGLEFKGSFPGSAGIQPDNLWLWPASLTPGCVHTPELGRGCGCIAHSAIPNFTFCPLSTIQFELAAHAHSFVASWSMTSPCRPSPADCIGLLCAQKGKKEKDSSKPCIVHNTERLFCILN